jgi:hypothetical protein
MNDARDDKANGRMTMRKNWLERLTLVASGWALGILTGLSIAKWVLY